MRKFLKMTPALKTTNKLFYKKWLYKITAYFDSINYVKRCSYDTLIKIRNNVDAYPRFSLKDINEMIKLKTKLESWDLGFQFQSRAEGNSISFFTNDTKFINEVKSHFKKSITEIVEPESVDTAKLLTDNVNIVICEKLPKNNQRYKVYLNSKFPINADLAMNFYNWSVKYSNKINIPYGLKQNLSSNRNFVPYGYYFYTSDDKILSMALMFLGKHVQTTEKFLLKSELNG
jgi:hypothetical protein